MMKNKSTYEIMSPEYIGLTRASESGIVLGMLLLHLIAVLFNSAHAHTEVALVPDEHWLSITNDEQTPCCSSCVLLPCLYRNGHCNDSGRYVAHVSVWALLVVNLADKLHMHQFGHNCFETCKPDATLA